jgi:integrase/recombinase XerD
MSFKKNDYYTLLQQACDTVPEFKIHYLQFVEKATVAQSSQSLIMNYSRSVAQVALHFNRLPHAITTDELNSYLYRLCVHEGKSEGYFKQAVYGLRYWLRMFGCNEMALRMPPVKKKQTLPQVLSKQECRELFKSPRLLKHRFLLAFAYGAGLRMNELRLLRIADVDVHRMQIHVRQGKGRKDRYVVLSKIIADKLPLYLKEVKPKTYLFEGLTPGEPMGSCVAMASTFFEYHRDYGIKYPVAHCDKYFSYKLFIYSFSYATIYLLHSIKWRCQYQSMLLPIHHLDNEHLNTFGSIRYHLHTSRRGQLYTIF